MGYHIGTLSQDPECASLKLVDKMAETVILFGLFSGYLNRELQLALHLAHEEIVDDDIAIFRIQFVLDAN